MGPRYGTALEDAKARQQALTLLQPYITKHFGPNTARVHQLQRRHSGLDTLLFILLTIRLAAARDKTGAVLVVLWAPPNLDNEQDYYARLLEQAPAPVTEQRGITVEGTRTASYLQPVYVVSDLTPIGARPSFEKVNKEQGPDGAKTHTARQLGVLSRVTFLGATDGKVRD